MGDAPTPETDEIVRDYESQRANVGDIIEHAEGLERERDEARAESKLHRSRVGVLLLSLESADKELSTLRAQVAELRQVAKYVKANTILFPNACMNLAEEILEKTRP